MKENFYLISKYASIIYRLGQPYFDRELHHHHIGCGQQFFLLRVYENPGISMLDLAKKGHYDKGTTNRAVGKLEQLGYIRVMLDDSDKRVRRLYTTEKSTPVIRDLYDILKRWNAILTSGMSAEEMDAAERLLEKASENAFHFMQRNKENECLAKNNETNITKKDVTRKKG